MVKMDENVANELLMFIATNLETESIFLTPTPQAKVDVIKLLNKIAELRGIDNTTNGEQFNKIMDQLEK